MKGAIIFLLIGIVFGGMWLYVDSKKINLSTQTYVNVSKNYAVPILEDYQGNGINISYDSKRDLFILNGTVSSSFGFVLASVDTLENFTISIWLTSGVILNGYIDTYVYANNNAVYSTLLSDSVDYSYRYIPYTLSRNYYYIYFSTGAVYGNATFRLQVEKGSKSTFYAKPLYVEKIELNGNVSQEIFSEAQKDWEIFVNNLVSFGDWIKNVGTGIRDFFQGLFGGAFSWIFRIFNFK